MVVLGVSSMKSRMMPLGVALLLLGLGAVLLSAVSKEKKRGDEKVRKVRVSAERFHFIPSRIRVKKGRVLEIELSSQDTFHGFRMPKADIDVTIPARGQGKVRIRFRARKAGSYAFECSRPCGAGHTMMRGTIVVE